MALGKLVTAVSYRIQPFIMQNLRQRLWGFLFPAEVVVVAIGVKLALARDHEFRAFVSSSIYLAGMMSAVVFGIYSMVLPSRNRPSWISRTTRRIDLVGNRYRSSRNVFCPRVSLVCGQGCARAGFASLN